MTATTETLSKARSGDLPVPRKIKAPLAVVEVKRGWLSVQNASGYATPATGSAQGGLRCFGVCSGSFDNSAGSAGDIVADFEQGVFEFENSSSGDALTIADVGAQVFAADNQTVAKTSNAGARPFAGYLVGFSEASKPLVVVGIGVALQSTKKAVLLSLFDFREVDASSDVGAIAANGGILASDTTPILRANATEVQEISWATGNADPIALQTSLPPDFDGSVDATLDLWVNSGTTDAASFTVESSWDGGALVSDAADDSATKSATTHKVSVTIAAADVPNSPEFLSLVLTPPAHATNAIQLVAVRLNYQPKLAS